MGNERLEFVIGAAFFSSVPPSPNVDEKSLPLFSGIAGLVTDDPDQEMAVLDCTVTNSEKSSRPDSRTSL